MQNQATGHKQTKINKENDLVNVTKNARKHFDDSHLLHMKQNVSGGIKKK
jgi:hypothetical protein